MDSANSATVYQLKVTLKGSKPPVWRRFLVSSDVKLSTLHDVIQDVMGWYDDHLHHYRQGRVFYEPPSGDSDFGPFGNENVFQEKKFTLNQVLLKPKDKIVYEYDFGDGWEHDLVLEKILDGADKIKTPVCLKGAGACPPEDCGGIYGYYALLEILNNPDDPEYEETMEWMGGEFDPDEFDIDAINKLLKKIKGA